MQVLVMTIPPKSLHFRVLCPKKNRKEIFIIIPSKVFPYQIECQQVEFRLEPGDLIAFNNRTMVHARSGFVLNGGARIMQVGTIVVINTFILGYNAFFENSCKPFCKSF